MEMTPNEIIRNYNAAKHPKMQIDILADLNDTTPEEIKKIISAKEEKKEPKKKEESKRIPMVRSEYVLSLVVARMDEVEHIIKEYEKEYMELSDFIKAY